MYVSAAISDADCTSAPSSARQHTNELSDTSAYQNGHSRTRVHADAQSSFYSHFSLGSDTPANFHADRHANSLRHAIDDANIRTKAFHHTHPPS